jgi:hypothetical protein
MSNRKAKSALRIGGLVVLIASATSSVAQLCPLCVNSVAASKPAFIAGLRHGILILLFPPLAICLSIGLATYRRRNQFNEESEDDAGPSPP